MNHPNKIPVLDHGFVRLLNIASAVPRDVGYGDEGHELLFSAEDIDPAIVARISFNNFDEGRSEEQDLALVEYLMSHHHNTPVEMTEVWLHMQMPIFVARQFVRHRTACINEVSARYAVLPEQWYIPKIVGGKSASNKQGQSDNLPIEIQESFQETLIDNCAASYNNYQHYLSRGVAPEHARLFLHVNHYTHWVYKQDLHNLMHFLMLRLDSHAQVEAVAYAEAIYQLLKVQLPKTMEFFDVYRRMATKAELELIFKVLTHAENTMQLEKEEREIIYKLTHRTAKQLR